MRFLTLVWLLIRRRKPIYMQFIYAYVYAASMLVL